MTVLPLTVPGEPVSLVLPGAARLSVRVPALATSDLFGSVALVSSDGRAFQTLGPGGELQQSWPLVAGLAGTSPLLPGVLFPERQARPAVEPAADLPERKAAMERKAWVGAVLVSLLALAGVAPPAEAGAAGRRAGLRPAAKPGHVAYLGGIAGEVWHRLIRLAGANRWTIDPNGQTAPGDDPDNRSTIDPNGQLLSGESPDNRGTIDPNG